MSFQFQLGEGGERERARERETEKEDVDDDGGCGVDDDKECDEEREMIVILMIVIMMIMMIIIMMVMYNCPIEISHQGHSGRFSGEASCDRVALPNLQCVQGFSVFQKSSYGRAYAIFLHAYTYTYFGEAYCLHRILVPRKLAYSRCAKPGTKRLPIHVVTTLDRA